MRKGMMGGGREREGMRSDSRSIRSWSIDEKAALPTFVNSGDASAVAVAPAARSKLMQSMCPCHAA